MTWIIKIHSEEESVEALNEPIISYYLCFGETKIQLSILQKNYQSFTRGTATPEAQKLSLHFASYFNRHKHLRCVVTFM